MTKGVGGADAQTVLAQLSNQVDASLTIEDAEFEQRIAKAQTRMSKLGVDGIYLNAGTNLRYFTGTQWFASERLVGAYLPSKGELQYIVPHFEIGSFKQAMMIEGPIASWQEHEDPYALLADVIRQNKKQATLERAAIEKKALNQCTVAVCENTPFYVANHLNQRLESSHIVDGKNITAYCRMQKSSAEIALIQQAMTITLEVHKAAASILKPGITTTEVEAFINQAHVKLAGVPSYFCIVLFGEATQYPHGVKEPQVLEDGDIVLIDTGCRINGYISDITRTYVFGEPSQEQTRVWNAEKSAQAAAFAAAQLGQTCASVDQAARADLAKSGFSKGYDLPGLPHRAGHGIGMDIHEWPYLVGNDQTLLAEGMCFSNEPMICIDGGFGIRLEDHFYMTKEGPQWFTLPSASILDPFGLKQCSD
jgi:Xaa-Pro dipeptidase